MSDRSANARELLETIRDMDAVGQQAVVAFLQALKSGQEREAAFQAGNAVITRSGRPPLSWGAYSRFTG